MTCLFLMFLALIITLSITSRAINELRQARKITNGFIALSIAEAGAEYTIAQLRASSAFTGTGGNVAFGGEFNTVLWIRNGRTRPGREAL